ncbi:hypothetical protein K503DRAFT_856362 [Rhizopogon vinicolor AM-OR11-026]|uniref:Uncharacterized protein n=1 Tax=Rhizopogon vinicolor AM-OR11-026 TaxID=1314800 RepID=A0A1B7N259_9AGAM|nr:hypothetical protein K503DRAFT_856362 [Rhizopogon vinicolor AM-OR11-026]
MSNETINGRFLSSSSSVDSDALKPIRADTMSTTSHINAKSKAKATSMRSLRMTAYRDDSHEMTNVPYPVQGTGIPPPIGDTIYFTPPPITAPQEYHAASLKSTSTTPVSTFIPLPPLLSAVPTPTAENVHAIGITTALSPASSTPPAQVQSPAPSHLVSKTPAIALSVLGGVVLLGILIAIRIARRPRRRKCPTPSLPILQDAAFPGQFESQGSESPIFGGKERFSPSLRGARNTGLWTWTQYHSGLQKPAPTVIVTKSTSGESVKGSGSEESSLSHSNFGQRTQAPSQPALATISRLSTISASYYPHTLPAMNVGVTIDGTAPLRGDGQAMKHAKDCGGNNSTIAPPDAKDASSLDQYRNLAYSGMDMITPALAESGRRPPNGGRVRIKSTYYTPGSYPRTSAARPAPKDREQYDSLYPDGLQRSDSHRGREEQALISVLGLNYSVPPSSHPTLSPENSTSTIGETKKVTFTGMRSQKKPVPKAIINDDKMSTNSAAHGSLMMVGLAASKAPASLVNIRPSEAGRETREPQSQERASVMVSGQPKTIMKKRVEDKPPRVPSPPLLPSLAQMGLAHTNPEAYTDYHSPTYSIYGLYDGDRKSGGT